MKSQKAFTLIELMIVMAIMAFLAGIAVPQYFQYQLRARQAEAGMILASLHTAQQAYFAENGKYTSVLNGDQGLGWKPEGYRGGGADENFYYTYGFNVPGAQEGVHYFTGKLCASRDSLGQTYADQTGFVAKAAADLRGKNNVDVWQIDESRKISHVQNGV
ncbi:prepilin-type N-terminal cleavage/methylation domain-containing protein [Candidatus Babeliales bacterium]|nr:prepilin-type N-terminal cleavage/methylation domain-containing protein [Candidatus Babeliales bacterium]